MGERFPGETPFDVSPDGSQLVVADRTGRVRVFSVGGRQLRDLRVEKGMTPQSVNWSWDGTGLYLSGMFGGTTYWIVRMDLDGNIEVIWESDNAWAFNPLPSPDGSRLALHVFSSMSEICMIEGF
jgi:Tol biopolymer transport system component